MVSILLRSRPTYSVALSLANHPPILASSSTSSRCTFLRGKGVEWQGSIAWLKRGSAIHSARPVTAMAGGDVELTAKKCIPCEDKSVQPLNTEQAQSLLQQVPGWELRQKEDGALRLHREYKVRNFTKGLELFSRVAALAEAEGHHPDLHLTGWNNVSLDLWTHSIGGLHENDFIMAAKISSLDVEDIVKRKQAKKTS